MGGKNWTPEQISYLQENWGEKTIPQIAKALGRSSDAIAIKSNRLGLGNQMDSGSLLNARRVSYLLGVDVHAITDYWIPKCGLKGKKQNIRNNRKQTVIRFDDLLDWLKKNQDKWDSRRVEKYALGMEYDWLIKKRGEDQSKSKRKSQKWTPYEDAQAIKLFQAGMTYQQIGKELDRSMASVEHRIHRLDVWGTGRYVGDKKKAPSEKYTKACYQMRLLQLLKMRFNSLNFDGYWQKDICQNWDDIAGCLKGEANCDECVCFVRIQPQICRRCGITFFERNPSSMCKRCRDQRKAQAARKYFALRTRGHGIENRD